MKILMIGLGSIGQRHLRNIVRIPLIDLEITAYRTRRLQQTFSDDMKIRENVTLEDEYNIGVFTSLEEALADKPDIAFITNITSKHMETAIECAKAGCDLFIEKPLSDTMDGAEELKAIIREKGLVVWTGFQNRYHPCVKRAMEILAEGKIGRILSADYEFSERLTTMHTYEDYRQTYMARSDMGGGPILNLLVHDLDLIRFMLGEAEEAVSVMAKTSGLEIDVEDSVSGIFNVEMKDGSKVPVYVHTDFLQFPPVHTIKIVGEKGRIDIDINSAAITVYQEGELILEEEFDDFARNDMFMEELIDYLECVNERKEPFIGIDDGIGSLKMALALKKSALEHGFTKV